MAQKQFPAPASMSMTATELADHIECQCLSNRDREVSRADVITALGPLLDGDAYGEESTSATEDDATIRVDAAFAELEARKAHCGGVDGRYPFEIGARGERILFDGLGEADTGQTYLCLLMATVLNMKTDRKHANLDGTQVFERLCEEVAVRFLGGPSSLVQSLVFGTARFGHPEPDAKLEPRGFEAVINDLCGKLQEGGKFQSYPDTRMTAKDDKLDVVAWRSFSDRRTGKLIAFGQCKTGTSWRSHLCDLRPSNFCSRWMLKKPVVDPIAMFFVSERLPIENWSNRSTDAGIIFDRCRIVDYAFQNAPLSNSLSNDMRTWLKAVCRAKELRLS